MHIVVCVKQVPDSTEIKINPETGTLVRTGVPSIMNPYDHFALETALNLKKEHDARVTVVSMGPPQAKSVVQLGLALGADEGVLLSDKAFAGSDTWATSYALSLAINKLGKFSLVLCGMQAIDGDTAQVGPGVAQQLSIPQVTFCEEVKVNGKKAWVRKATDYGYAIAEVDMPVLLTMMMHKDFEARYPSFLDIFNSDQKPYHVWTAEDIGAKKEYLGLKGSPTQVDRIYPPEKGCETQMLTGAPGEIAQKIVDILKKENCLR